MTKQPIMLSLSKRASELLSMNATPRKKGELVSEIIETYLTEDGIREPEIGVLEDMAIRLSKIERLLTERQ